MRAHTAIKRILCGCMLGLTLLCAGCATQVTPIDIHDPLISVESRRFVADAQDAVSIARSGVDAHRGELEEARERRETLLSNEAWAQVPASAKQTYQSLLDARVKLAELRLNRAQAELELARKKLDAVYAETAVRHDLETYELEPIRQEVDERLEVLRKINRQIGEHLLVVDKASRKWWEQYRGLLADKKHPDMFFTTK